MNIINSTFYRIHKVCATLISKIYYLSSIHTKMPLLITIKAFVIDELVIGELVIDELVIGELVIGEAGY